MHVYFVRHGESLLNAKNIHQDAQTKLSQKGIEQAGIVANRFETIPIDIILASPYERTKNTAEIIQKVVRKEIVFTELLREYKRPKEIEGLDYEDPKALEVKQLMREHAHDPNWHYSDEDNFSDLVKRAKAFLTFLEKRKEKHILAVTHGIMLRFIIASMIFEDALTEDVFHKVGAFLQTHNTGITICKRTETGWQLLTWNDYAHLGEV